MRISIGLAGIVGAALIIGGSSADAGLITSLDVTQSPAPGGLTRYEYTFTNTAASTIPAFALAINVAPTANLQVIEQPLGWEALYNSGDTEIVWTSSDEAFDLLANSSARFAFASALGPVLQDSLAAGIDPSGPALVFDAGITLAPGVTPNAGVPEPSAVHLGAIGILTIAAAMAIRREV
jgi:hypothetical protein